ncbi:BREX system serine/threonine kinase PglW [Tomitella gaofuii]|uniref:BREX system serine/threonine kinase PglW n=1 Tax=Tomitella gaofuii TaxID=2760083 RepID=UPI002E2A7DD2|nr:BREX system serine/threonine kinase PglW [Tomitella gaofuii]
MEVSPSQFAHERDGLELVKALLPDVAPYRAWSNFEFRDNRGRWHEVDLLVLTQDTLFMVELKYYSGVLGGNDHVWTRSGKRAEDSPLLLTRRKAQYFASLLKDRLAEKTGAPAHELKHVIPFVQELVFLHHPDLQCVLPASSKINLYGLDDPPSPTGLPGISEVLLAPPRHEIVSEEKSALIAELMTAIGLAPRRQREVGSWIIDDEPLGDGEGWQDWPAFHHVDAQREARIRFYLPRHGESSADEFARKTAVRHEYQLLARLRRDGLQAPVDIVDEEELGIGLVFDQPRGDERLDLWLTDHAKTLALEDQLELISAIAEIVQYAHRHRVVHRTLSPQAVAVRTRGGEVHPQVIDWDSAGVLPATIGASTTRLASVQLSLMAGAATAQSRAFGAPEGVEAADPARVDVFGLGALAFYILTGGTAPAADRGELMARLRRDGGLDLAADMPQVPSTLRQLVLDATDPRPGERLGDVGAFLDRLAVLQKELLGASDEVDPLDAGPGAMLADGAYEYQRRLGAGSTAVGILVTDHTAGDIDRVLKVAKDDEAAARLESEARVLGPLDDERRIVRLISRVTVGGRTALLLQYAGRTTLAEELASRGRLSIDVLERWGTDLLQALVALERAGVNHRDIKPSNLGVHRTSGKADTHLVMFDFSMAGVDPRNIEAGTPPYLDPFLGTGGRNQYDTAAERYGAAVVLFEMATGAVPQYGPDPDANPAAVPDDVTLTPAMFDSAVAEGLGAFFAAALARDAAARPDTAEDMLRGWEGVFRALDAAADAAPQDTAPAHISQLTPLSSAGMTARAVSALAGAEVTTVGELLTVDAARLNRIVAKEAKTTRAEIRERHRDWATKFGRRTRTDDGGPLLGLDEAAALLIEASSGSTRTTTRKQAAELILGARPGLDAFGTTAELAEALGKSAPRGQQLVKELQEAWGKNPRTAELLDSLVATIDRLLTASGGVVAVDTLTTEVEGELPRPAAAPSDAAARARADRQAAGLLRVALDRLSEHEQLEGESRIQRRRHGRRLALVATDQPLLLAAEAAGERADQLVAADPGAVIGPATAARALRQAFTDRYRRAGGDAARDPVPGDRRLLRLAAAVSRGVAVSGRGELHSRTLGPSEALRVALAGLAQTAAITPAEVRARVAARFPALDRLPTGEALDQMIVRAGLGLRRDEAAGVYRFELAAPPSDTTVHTRLDSHLGRPAAAPSAQAKGPAEAGARERERMFATSIAENGFLAVGVPVPRERPGEHLRAARALAQRYGAELVDVTGEIVAAMRALAEERGISWDLVRGADAAAEGSRDAKGLRVLVDTVMPDLRERLDAAVFRCPPGAPPLILVEPSPLARYGYMGVLAALADLTAPRRRPVWLVLPQVHGRRGALVDGMPVQLGAPGGQFVAWPPEATRTLEAAH